MTHLTHLYILPAERIGMLRGPKYFPWGKPRRSADAAPVAPLIAMESHESTTGVLFGASDLYLFAAPLDQTRHELLVAQPDVVGVPEDFDTLVNRADIAELDAMGFAVDEGATWRQVLREIAQMCLYAQRHEAVTCLQGLETKVVSDRRDRQKVGARRPASTLASLPRAQQLAMLLAAELHGIDSRTLEGSKTTVRDALRAAAAKHEPLTLLQHTPFEVVI